MPSEEPEMTEAEEFADFLMSVIGDAYEELEACEAEDMSPRMAYAYHTLGQVADPEAHSECCKHEEPMTLRIPHVDLESPWGTKLHVHYLTEPLVRKLWGAQIAVSAAGQGWLDDDHCDEHRQDWDGWLTGPFGYEGLTDDVFKILSSSDLKLQNLRLEPIEGNPAYWTFRFDRIAGNRRS